MQIKRAANKIANPTIPLIIPPTNGIYPSKVVRGEKNQQIPKTITK